MSTPQDGLDGLMPRIYQELRTVADRLVGRGGDPPSVQPTDIVHEVYLKLARSPDLAWEDESHFRAIAARAARQVLVDRARGRAREKRGGSARRLSLDTTLLGGVVVHVDPLEVEDALCRLEQQDPRAAQVVELRFFGGLSVDSVADRLDLSPATVAREWRYARAWLYDALFGGDGAG